MELSTPPTMGERRGNSPDGKGTRRGRRTCRPIPLRLGGGALLQRPALSPVPTSACLVHLRSLWDAPLRHTRGSLDNPSLIDHQGLCTAHCQATISPLSHLHSSLPPGHLRRHAIPATLQGAPHEALWLPFGSPLTVQPGSKQIPYLLTPTCTHMVYPLLRAP